MVTCWRCGVDWDNTGFIEGAPCEDCQYEVPGEWAIQQGLNEAIRSALAPLKSKLDEDIKRLHARGKLNTEICRELGIGYSTLTKYKKRLGLGSNVRKNLKLQEQRQELGRNLVKHRWGGK